MSHRLIILVIFPPFEPLSTEVSQSHRVVHRPPSEPGDAARL